MRLGKMFSVEAIAKHNRGGRAGRASLPKRTRRAVLPEREISVGSRVPRDRNGGGFAIACVECVQKPESLMLSEELALI